MIKSIYWERKEEIVEFVKRCQCENTGGFGGNISHDPHITNSLYALLILAMFDGIDDLGQERLDKLAEYMASLQNEDGSFSGDYGGEIDARFSYCAVSALSLLKGLDKIDKVKARDYVLRC